MAEQTLLIIDPNPQSLNVMEVQLRKHDYEVITAHSVERALQLLSISPPDLIISEYTLDAGESAVTLCQRLKGEVATQAIPFLIITQRDDQRVECLNAGADEVLVKPIYIAELRDRAEILLQKRRRLTLEQGVGQRFFGRLEEMGLLDLMQVIEVSKRSGQLMIEHKSTRGSIWFQDGDVHDAELGDLKGKDALCRLLTWEYGQYEFDFKASPRPNSIQSSLGELRSRGLNYVDQWNKMCEQLPPLDTVFRKDPSALTDRPEPLEELQRELVDRFDGYSTALEVLNQSPEPDLDVLQALTLLYFEGLIYESRDAALEDETPEPVFLDPQLSESPAETKPQEPEFDIETKAASSQDFGTNTSVEDEVAPPPVFEGEVAPSDEIPEEGQDLLAELYAARPETEDVIVASDFSPPPLPDHLQDDDDQADETYSTLFGIDGDFSYDEEESAFFEQLSQEPEDIFAEEHIKQPLSGGAKAFILILIASMAGVVSYALYDDVYPLKTTQVISPDWVEVAVIGRELKTPSMSSAEGDWKLELINRAEATSPTPEPDETSTDKAPKVSRNTAPRPQKKGGETQSFKKLMKQALTLMKKSKFRKGVELSERALTLQPTHPYALLLSATLHFELGDNKRSLELLQIMVRTKPRYGNTKLGRGYGPGVVYNLIGAAYDNLGNKSEALKHYESYLREFPKGVWTKDIKNIVGRLKSSLR